MIDDLTELVVAATADIVAGKAAKKHRWARMLGAIVGLLFVGLIADAIYVTFKYS